MGLIDDLIEVGDIGAAPVKVDQEHLYKAIYAAISRSLEAAHRAPAKLSIDDKGNRLNFACPYCGDSSHNYSKKRGNLYKEHLWYKCYNSPCVTKPLSAFISDHQLEDFFTPDELSYIANRAASLEHEGGPTFKALRNGAGYSEYLKLSEYGIPRQSLMDKMGLIEVHENRSARSYCEGRCLLPSIYRNNYHLAYDPHRTALVLFNLTHDNKVMGVQERYLQPKRGGVRFNSYRYDQLLEQFYGVDPKNINKEVMSMMSRVTLIYNFFRTDFSTKVLILESGIDANHIPNSIGLLSASTSINLKKNGYYMYDNSLMDKAGSAASTKKLGEGYKVFEWVRFLRDYPIYRGCKDLNDIFKLKPAGGDILYEYFTDDELDMLLI